MFHLRIIRICLLIGFTIFTYPLQTTYAFENNHNTGSKARKYYWIIYDDECPYCISAHRKIKLLDWGRKFRFASFKDPHTYKMFPLLSKEECTEDIHMITPKGEVLKGYDVFKTIINNLLPLKILSLVFKTKWGHRKLEKYYENIVQKRACYYKSDKCD